MNSEHPSDEGFDTPLGFDFGFAIPPPLDATDPTWGDRVASTVTPCEEVEHTLRGYDNDTPDYDAFWLERDYVVDAGRIDVPVLVAHNWGDWNVKQEEGINLYRALVNAPTKRLYMGSRYRGHGRPSVGYAATVDRWLDYYLLGIPNGVPASVPEVTSEMADDNGALGNYAGPWPSTTAVTLLAQEDALDPDYRWKLRTKSPRPPHVPKSAVFSFTTGTNTESTANANPRANTQWLWFETDPLAQDVRIFGNVEVRLWSTIAKSWITYTPTIVDVDPADRLAGRGMLLATDSTRIPVGDPRVARLTLPRRPRVARGGHAGRVVRHAHRREAAGLHVPEGPPDRARHPDGDPRVEPAEAGPVVYGGGVRVRSDRLGARKDAAGAACRRRSRRPRGAVRPGRRLGPVTQRQRFWPFRKAPLPWAGSRQVTAAGCSPRDG